MYTCIAYAWLEMKLSLRNNAKNYVGTVYVELEAARDIYTALIHKQLGRAA